MIGMVPGGSVPDSGFRERTCCVLWKHRHRKDILPKVSLVCIPCLGGAVFLTLNLPTAGY